MTVFAFVLLVAACVALSSATPLDDYVHAPDPAFNWTVVNSFRSPTFQARIYNIALTSQTWLTAADSSIHVWKHWLQVCVPDNRRPNVDWAFLYIDGGSNPVDPNNPPKTDDSETPFVVPFVCQDSGSISVALKQIPNEPAHFPIDWPVPNKRRTEDAIIALTWRHFFNDTSKPNWLLRLPMTKAVVRAMDALQSFTQQYHLGPLNHFGVAGASKRGWTTWTTMAVDKRVKAAIPIVMPILDTVPNINNHFRLLGGYSFALTDYANEGCIGYLNLPEWKAMNDVVDPITYNDRYTMPKYVVAATGDEFFPPDSLQYFWDKLTGPKILNLVPDAEHSLATGIVDVATSAAAFYYLQLNDMPLPKYHWTLTKSNGTSVSGHKAAIDLYVDPSQLQYVVDAQVWSATTLSTTRRDFRLITCRDLSKADCLQPVIWWPSQLHPVGVGHYRAEMDAPIQGGWTGFLIELQFEYADAFIAPRNHTLTVTSEMNTVPDTLPFAPCAYCSCGAACPPIPPPVV